MANITNISNRKMNAKQKMLIVLISFLFLTEFITTIYLYVRDVEITRIAGFYKLFLEFVFIIYIRFKKVSKIQFKLLFALVILYIINQLFNPIFFESITYQISKGSLYYLNRFVYPFVFIFYFLSLESHKEIAKSILKIIEYLLLINAVLMVFGVAFDIDILASYPQSSARFGSDGLFNKINETSYLYIILIAHSYYKIIHGKENVYKLIVFIAASFLLGTKAVLFFLGLLFLFHCMFVSRFKRTFRIVCIPGLVLGILFFSDMASFLFELSPFWRELGNRYSLTTLLFSTRDILLMDNLAYIAQNWGFINYLIGGPYYTADFFNIEMDLPDLILFFGAIGAIIYLILLKLTYFKNNSFLTNSLIFLVILTGFFAGGLFLSVIAMIYLYLFKIETLE